MRTALAHWLAALLLAAAAAGLATWNDPWGRAGATVRAWARTFAQRSAATSACGRVDFLAVVTARAERRQIARLAPLQAVALDDASSLRRWHGTWVATVGACAARARWRQALEALGFERTATHRDVGLREAVCSELWRRSGAHGGAR